MKQLQAIRNTLQWQKLTVPILCVLLALVASPFTSGLMNAATESSSTVSATTLSGELSTQNSRHWFTLEVTGDDDDDDGTTVNLRLSYDPQDDALDGLVNFYVLSSDGVRSYENGAKLGEVNLAKGSADRPEKEDYSVMTASFTDRVRDRYTVIVYNNSATPIRYSLSVEGALLHDNSAQTIAAAGMASVQATVAPVAPTGVASDGVQSNDPTTLMGSLPAQSGYIWLGMKVTGDDDDDDGNHVKVWLSYDPQDDALDGLVNFFILSPEGLRNHEGGTSLREANLAAGSPYKPEKEDYAVNMAEFTERGYQNYSVVLFNRSNTPVQYKLWVEGGELSGGEAQTTSVASSDVVRTDMGNSNTAVTDASVVNVTSVTQPAVGTITTQSAPAVQTASNTRMNGQLNKAHEWHFATVRPIEQDGEMVLTLDVDPDDNDAVQFYVFTPASLRDVVNGASPRLVNLGAGSPVDDNQDGDQDSGKLRATVKATSYESYTVIIYSDTDATASYTLMVEEGELVR